MTVLKYNSSVLLYFCIVLPCIATAISITYHDKPETARISRMATKMNSRRNRYIGNRLNITIPSSERQKRLLPYVNFYDAHKDSVQRPSQASPKYQILLPKQGGFQLFTQGGVRPGSQNKQPGQEGFKQKPKVTPFLESNALPGPFVPIATNQLESSKGAYTTHDAQPPYHNKEMYEYLPQYDQTKPADFVAIYEKLSELKMAQNSGPSLNHPVEITNVYSGNENVKQNNDKRIQRPNNYQTVIKTYVPTNIDITTTGGDYYKQTINPLNNYESKQIEAPQANYAYKQVSSPITEYTLKPARPQNTQQGTRQFIHQGIVLDVPLGSYPYSEQPIKMNDQRLSTLKQIIFESPAPPKPVYESKPEYQIEKAIEYRPQTIIEAPKPAIQKPPIIYIQRRPATSKKPVLTIIDDKYVAQKFLPVFKYENNNQYATTHEFQPQRLYPVQQYHTVPNLSTEPQQTKHMIQPTIVFEPFTPHEAQKIRPVEKYQLVTQKTVNYNPPQTYNEQYQTPYPKPAPQVPTEDSNTLTQLLKQLQDSNTLPPTITPDNIDNSIKTLVKILSNLKSQDSTKPIIVPQTQNVKYNDYGDNEQKTDSHSHDVHGTVTQSFPAQTEDGGTPGKPGVDYPALAIIPKTSFNCKTQRYKGFFGDPDTKCQVWHYCDLNGGQASFLCPNGTIFSQVALTCDWWYNVKCSTTTQLYVLNERLYKYILPFSPKFPEDYSGPLVDKYLALKFQEMEEKMKKQKKGKGNKSKEEKKDTDEVQSPEQEEITDEENSTASSNESSEKVD